VGDLTRAQLELAQASRAEAQSRLAGPLSVPRPPLEHLRELERTAAALEAAIAATDERAGAQWKRLVQQLPLERLARVLALGAPLLVGLGLGLPELDLTGRPVAAWLVTAVICIEVTLCLRRSRPGRSRQRTT
jgi:hypothetical protein